jgi:hypothetical protein
MRFQHHASEHLLPALLYNLRQQVAAQIPSGKPCVTATSSSSSYHSVYPSNSSSAQRTFIWDLRQLLLLQQ